MPGLEVHERSPYRRRVTVTRGGDRAAAAAANVETEWRGRRPMLLQIERVAEFPRRHAAHVDARAGVEPRGRLERADDDRIEARVPYEPLGDRDGFRVVARDRDADPLAFS